MGTTQLFLGSESAGAPPTSFLTLFSSLGRLGPVTLALSGGDPRGLFSLDSASGLLQTLRPLDRELLGPVLELEVRAGSGVPPAFTVARVRVLLDDVNDNSPAFPTPEDTVMLPPNTALGTPIYTLRALDPDSGVNSRVTFTLLAGGDGAFTVDPTTGHVRLIGPLGPPGGPAHELELEARDGGSPPRKSHFRLRVVVQDLGIRGLAPRFDSSVYRVDLPSGTAPGTQVLQVQAQAPDGSPITYHLAADGASSPFGLEPQSGWLWVRAALDPETQELYTLKVMAVSGSKAELGQQTGTATVRVSILNQNDHSPRLSEEPTFLAVAENQSPGTSVGRVFATDRDSGPNGRLTYSLRQLSEDSKAFRIHPQTGKHRDSNFETPQPHLHTDKHPERILNSQPRSWPFRPGISLEFSPGIPSHTPQPQGLTCNPQALHH